MCDSYVTSRYVCQLRVKISILEYTFPLSFTTISLISQLKNTVSSSCHKGRSRISMVWVPLLRFHPYCGSKWLLLQDEFTLSIKPKKNFLLKLEANFEKWKNQIFSKTAQPIMITKIYVIEGTKEVLKKIQEPFMLKFKVTTYIFSKIIGEVLHN